MKATRFFQTALLILGIGFTIACGDDNIENMDHILGRWDLQEAIRNGRPTESLKDLFFEFFEEGKMRTNITGTPTDGSFKIDGDQMLQRDTPLEADYTIQTLNDTLLVLTAQINKFNFKLHFSKTVQEE